MTELNKAFVLGGLGEFPESLEPLVNELDSGEHRIVDEAEPVTWNEFSENPDKFHEEAKRRIVIARSISAASIKKSGMAMSLCGVEPRTLRQAASGAIKIQKAFDGYMGHEPQIEDQGELFIPELMANKRATVRAVRGVFRDSTIANFISGGTEAFGDRHYVVMDQDEYGFGSNGEIERASIHGIKAVMLNGFHNTPTSYPVATAENISNILNS